MIFHRARQKKHMINIKINKVQIEQTKHTKFLGIIFDDNLCWSNHISYINIKIAKGIGIICRAKKYFNTSALINLYNAFVFPYLIYCVEVWGNALSTHIQPLVKLQNKIVRIITYSYHTTEQLYTHKNTPIKNISQAKDWLINAQITKGNVPKALQNLYKCNRDVHTHFTRQAHHFHSMRGNNEFIYRTFVFQSVVIWNKIIQNINIHVSYPRFKHLLKNFLLSDDVTFRYDK